MQTSATTPRVDASRSAGFTLLEILIVAFVIGILSVLFLPRISKRLEFELDNTAEILSAELRYAAERAVSTGDPHRLVVDLDTQELRLERIAVNEPAPVFELPSSPALLDLRPPRPEQESKPVPERQGDWHALAGGGEVRIEAVVIGDQEYDKERVAIAFGGDGGADPASIRLVDDAGNRLTLQIEPFTAEVKTQRASAP